MTVTGSVPFPFITKEGSLGSFKTTSAEQFNQDFNYGDAITGSYPLSASISSDFLDSGLYLYGTTTRKYKLLALKNTLNYYSKISPHYTFSSSLGDKELQDLRMISVPSIFYGQSLKKGSVSCKWYYTGSLIAELQDINENGELVQVGPSGSNGSGSIAGVVLYKEGFVFLTGSWSLHDSYTDYFDVNDSSTLYSPSWKYFLTTGSSSPPATKVPNSSFLFDFDGTEKIPVLTMFARSDRGEHNFSNNPTYIEHGQSISPITSSNGVIEPENINIKNIVSSSYEDVEPDFEKITYISKVAIYDKNKNLIGVAKLANPIKKKQNDNIAIKMKLDL